MLLAKEGASAVMIGDLDMVAAGEVVSKCLAVATNSQFRAEAVKVDVTKEQSVRGIFERMVDVFGRVDYCVNCAGVSAAMCRYLAWICYVNLRYRLELKTLATLHQCRFLNSSGSSMSIPRARS